MVENQIMYESGRWKLIKVSDKCCCCLVAQLCLTLCNPMDCSTPGFPVLHYLPEFAQTHSHRVSDATQPSHPLLPSSPPALNLSHWRPVLKGLVFSTCIIKHFSDQKRIFPLLLKQKLDFLLAFTPSPN